MPTSRWARRRRRRARHQARSRHLFRGGRPLADRAHQRTSVLHHQSAERLARVSNSSNATPCRARRTCSNSLWCWRPQALSADRSGRGSRGSPRWRRSSYIPGTVSRGSPRTPVVWCDPRSRPSITFGSADPGRGEKRARRLDGLGLTSFCKTTGARVSTSTPRRRPEDKRRCLAGGEGIRPRGLPAHGARQSEALRRQHGEEASRRTHPPDDLRNDRMATAIAPLSTRARPGARCRCR